MNFTVMIILALIGEAIWETTKMFWQKGKLSIDRVGTVVVCLILAFGASLDMFALIGIPLAIPYVGTFFTGLLISRGANVIHDLFEKFRNVKPIEPFNISSIQQGTILGAKLIDSTTTK